MILSRNSFLALATSSAIAIATLSACAGGPSDQARANGHDEAHGSVALSLKLPPSVDIDTVTWSLSGNGVATNGSVDVGAATGLAFVIPGVPAGAGYTVALSATSRDGALHCAGQASVETAANQTASASVRLQCDTASGVDVNVSGSFNLCPRIASVVATPDAAVVGVAASLRAVATDGDASPAALTYAWSASSGALSTPAEATTSFTCAAPGTTTISVVVSDGECSKTATLAVACSAPPPATPSDLLAKRGAACLACATQSCPTELDAASTMTGTASAGPRAGAAKSDLVRSSLACVLDSACATTSAATCYCGTASGTACLAAGSANGPCKSELEAALETTEPATVAVSFGDDTLAGGRAVLLTTCLSDSGCTSCF